jgi:hypothetical protein
MATGAEIFALHRYFIWANEMRVMFDGLLQSRPVEGDGRIRAFLYMSYWYAALYVVIEGWRSLGLSDAEIDALLESPNVALLKRYRNGVFHFQRTYYDERFLGLIRDGEDAVAWVRSLNSALGRFLLETLRAYRTGDLAEQAEQAEPADRTVAPE